MSKTVLVVDDSVSMRQMVTFTLKGAGFEVVEAGDGKEALEKLASGPFNLVITDFHMPRVSGLALLVAMAKDNMLETTPVIVITGELDKEIRKDSLACGASAVLTKPYQPTELLSTVAKTMNRWDLKTRSNGSG